MSLLFSSHLLPDVEAVCDYVMVLAHGKLLVQGRLADLKRGQQGRFQVRVKAESERFLAALQAHGVVGEQIGEEMEITLQPGQDQSLLWRVALEQGVQIRLLRPKRSTLEDVFLQAVRD
jgi:ABC-2 type transport system ATP-binding protein